MPKAKAKTRSLKLTAWSFQLFSYRFTVTTDPRIAETVASGFSFKLYFATRKCARSRCFHRYLCCPDISLFLKDQREHAVFELCVDIVRVNL